MSNFFTPSNRSVSVIIFRVSRVIYFDVYTRQESNKPYLKCDLCGTFLLLRADGTSPKMIEHWGKEKCKKTLEKLERQKANKLEVRKAEIAHDEAFGNFASDAHCKFIIIDSVIENMLQYHDSMY
jgi:hypothetical protein